MFLGVGIDSVFDTLERGGDSDRARGSMPPVDNPVLVCYIFLNNKNITESDLVTIFFPNSYLVCLKYSTSFAIVNEIQIFFYFLTFFLIQNIYICYFSCLFLVCF